MSDPAPGGIIHDIGYRHYDGPRLGRAHARATLFVDGLKGAFGFGRSTRAKIAPLLLLGAACIPAFIQTIVMVVIGADSFDGAYLTYGDYVQVLVSIFVAVLAPGLVSRDLRSRMLVLYFSRPLHRIDYVLAKLAAAFAAMVIFTVTPLLALFVGSLLAQASAIEHLPDLLRAIASSVLLSALLATLGLLVAALAPRRGMGIAAIMTVLLVSTAASEILISIGEEGNIDPLATYAGLLTPYTVVEQLTANVLGAASARDAFDSALPTAIYALAAIGFVALGMWLLTLRYRRVARA